MTEGPGETETGVSSQNKVAKLIERYGLYGVGDELEASWTATGEKHRSLRDLADYFNRQLLEARLADAGIQTVDGEIENMYRLLTDDSVTEGDRIRLQRRLERDGVDTDQLREQFVSYQTIRRYLKRIRDAEYTQPEIDRLERESQNLQRLQGRVESVTTNKLERLRGSSLTLGDFRATVDVRVYCEGCNTQYDVQTLLEQGACDCDA